MSRWRWGWRRACALLALGAASGALAGCDGAPEPCLPPEAAALVSAPAAPTSADVGPVDVYVDGSGSMAGFIRGATPGDRPLQDLVARLPWIAGGLQRPASFTLFGRDLHPLSVGREALLASDGPYACRTADALPCDNQETRLDKVLAAIKARPADHLSVLVTDLWLTGQDLSAGPSALSGPLSDVLAGGRAVGVVGIRAPYSGPIYDIPNAPSFAGARSHPLFVLLVGPVERVVAFHERLGRLGGGFAGQRERGGGWSLFTLHPLAPQPAGARPLQVTPGTALAEAPVLPLRAGLDVQQLVLRRGSALRSLVRGGDAGQGVFTAHPAVQARPGAVWTGALEPVVRLWRAKSAGAVCHAGAWTAVGRLPTGWTAADTPAPRFVLNPAEASAHLPPGGVYLLAGSLERPRLQTPNPADRWMRDWSFDASSAPAVLASRPAFFPTLNLGETADLLEEALDQASSRAPASAGGFAAVVRVDR